MCQIAITCLQKISFPIPSNMKPKLEGVELGSFPGHGRGQDGQV